MIFQQQLARMAEGHPVRAHHPVDYRATGITPKAVPKVGFGAHDTARSLIPFVPRTAASEVLALRDQPMALALDEPHQANLLLQALQLRIRDARHPALPKTLSRGS